MWVWLCGCGRENVRIFPGSAPAWRTANNYMHEAMRCAYFYLLDHLKCLCIKTKVFLYLPQFKTRFYFEKNEENRIVISLIVFLLWLFEVGQITTFCETFSCSKYTVSDVISRCCTSFVMAASTAAYLIHHGVPSVAGGLTGISCGNGSNMVGISKNRLANRKRIHDGLDCVQFVRRHGPNQS